MSSLTALGTATLIWYLALWQRCVRGRCFYPNGNPAPDGDQPCAAIGDSACCPLDWQCLSNGLCYLQNEGYYGRYTCTDKTWQSPNCPEICTHNKTASGNEAILQCSKGSYCCDANRPDVGCCETTNAFFTLPGGNSIASISPDGPIYSNVAVAADNGTSSEEGASSATSLSPLSSISISTPRPTSTNPATSTPTFASRTAAASPTPTSGSSTIPSRQTSGRSATTLPAAPGTSIVILTSVIINSAGISSSVITSQLIAPQSSTAANISTTEHKNSTNLGLKVGLGVGIPVGIIALGLLGFLLWKRKKTGRSRTAAVEGDVAGEPRNMDYMYKGNTDFGTPPSATTASPDLNKRASSKYVISDPGSSENRGVKPSGLGLHQESPELPNSTARSELSGSSLLPHKLRNSQTSELAGSRHNLPELP